MKETPYARVLKGNTILIVVMVNDLEKVLTKMSKIKFRASLNLKRFKVIIRDVIGNYYLYTPDRKIINLNTKHEKVAIEWKPLKEQFWDNV